MSYKILVVDDEPDITAMLKDFFELQGYMVYTAQGGKEALEKAAFLPDLIILDINMPDMDGLTVCKTLRSHISCPILFLTAKVEEQDKINGLQIGGDDYIVKPFGIEELGARVAAHLRREERHNIKTELKFFDDLVIQYTERCLYYKEEKIALTKTEFDIVELLSMHKGQVFDKETLYERLWGYDKEGNSSIMTEHIRRIRQKIGAFTDKVYIDTVWGVGYKWIG